MFFAKTVVLSKLVKSIATFSFFCFVYLLFFNVNISSVNAGGSATVLRGHSPVVVGWFISGGYDTDTNCAPTTNVEPSVLRNAWMNFAGGSLYGNVNLTNYGKPTVPGVNYFFTCQHSPGGPLDTSYLTVNDCAVGYVWNPATEVCDLVPPPVVNLSATPSHVNSGNSVTLSWTVTGNVTSCTASGGAWFGSKSISGSLGSPDTVNPTANTTYTLTCNGPGGPGSDFKTVRVPTGNMSFNPPTCTIPIGGSNCSTSVTWTSSDLFGSTEVALEGVPFGSTPNNLVGVTQLVNEDKDTFTLEDKGSGGVVLYTRNYGVTCASNSVWAGPVGSKTCVRLPDIDIVANPNVIRSGKTAPLTVTITANYDMSCDIKGGTTNQRIDHYVSSGATQVYTRTTDTLTSSQVVEVTCENTLYPVVNGSDSTKVEVTASFQET